MLARWLRRPRIGAIPSLIDRRLAPVIHRQWAPTIDLQVQFLAPALPGEYHGRGRVVRRGRDIGFMAGELRSADGTLVATATASAIIRQRRF